MKKIFKVLLIIIILFPFNVFSLNVSVIDMDSGRILYEKQGDERRLIASTTNIMTI